MVKQRTFILALATALLLMLVVGSVAFADGPTVAQQEDGKICVDGYVINHREQPVDGSKVPLVVNAVDANNGVVASATVDEDGYFKFADLAEGSYNFQLQLPTGWEGIVPEAELGGLAETGLTAFAESETCYRILFKIRRIVDIPVLKWEEQLDGTVVPGEDWLITATPLKDPFAVVVTATITNGSAVLPLTPGTWRVAETVKSGWTPLTPPVVTRVVDQYQGTGALNPIVFKNREPVCHPSIPVTKIGYGTNPDGGQEVLGPLAGWRFTVSRADKTMPSITQVTGGDGTTTFENLRPGVYTVTETVQAGWEVIGDNPVTVVLSSCDEIEPVVFENQELIGDLRIYGTKWFKAWEKPYKGTTIGLPGWQITATLVGTNDAVTTFTDALGQYEFTQDTLGSFPGATYEVCEEERDHWIAKTPVCVTVKFPSLPVPADYTGVKVDFTNFQDPPVPGAASTTMATASGSCSAYHTVVGGDTVAKLAGKYGVSARGIVQANNIKNADVIYRGQRLCIP